VIDNAKRNRYFARGWCRFEHDPALLEWTIRALPHARAAVVAKENARWLRCGGTWFVGVNALPNDTAGAVGDSGPLAGSAVEFIRGAAELVSFHWDAAQISVCYPGYPQTSENESISAYRFRLEKDAAHVDGLLPVGAQRRRHLQEYHGFILGIPLVEFSADASPLVAWEGSHEIIREAFRNRFAGLSPRQWANEDVTDVYQEARRRVLAQCPRKVIHAHPGEAFLVHRLAVHGVVPWQDNATAGSDGRIICYFRPETGGPEHWLEAP
jgi:hypothetical protein